jgi:hypothetical protein
MLGGLAVQLQFGLADPPPVLRVKRIVPVKPLMTVAVIVEVNGLTGFVVMLVGEADRLKS